MNKDEWSAWKNYELTEKVFEELQQEVDDIKQAWSEGQFVKNEAENIKHIGIIEGINRVLNKEVEDDE